MPSKERSAQAIIASLLVGFAPWVWQQFLTGHTYRFAAGVGTVAILAALYFKADDLRKQKIIQEAAAGVQDGDLETVASTVADKLKDRFPEGHDGS